MAEYPENVWIWDDHMNGGRGWDTEDRGCSKPYLRADTCTPNERLEVILEALDECQSHLSNNARTTEEMALGLKVNELLRAIEKKLREVMNK